MSSPRGWAKDSYFGIRDKGILEASERAICAAHALSEWRRKYMPVDKGMKFKRQGKDRWEAMCFDFTQNKVTWEEVASMSEDYLAFMICLEDNSLKQAYQIALDDLDYEIRSRFD